ncbi:MAG: DUF1848 domain-containing protein [Acidobacteriota bacterium]|nr:DUF1848 domain-containing protein [Acidobacteriota bacterium]
MRRELVPGRRLGGFLKSSRRSMIVSASRRTDIPAFYGRWFLNRLRAGHVLVANPRRRLEVRRVDLDPASIDGIVFWTKNPEDFLSRLPGLDAFEIPYDFLFTITGYGPSIEPNLPPKRAVIETFKRLSDRLGPERVIWRYDPIFLTPAIGGDEHLRRFESLARNLEGYTTHVIIAFLTLYRKSRRHMESLKVSLPEPDDARRLLLKLKRMAAFRGMTLGTCAVSSECHPEGTARGACIDARRFERMIGRSIPMSKDPGQRKECLCVRSVDIGAYDTCAHTCLYCYANASPATALRNRELHDPDGPILLPFSGPGGTSSRA